MEAAIRWPLDYDGDSQNFLIADVSGNSLQYCQVQSVEGSVVEYQPVLKRDKLPNFTAFDWSKSDDNVVAIGTTAGEAKVIRLDDSSGSAFTHSFPVKLQRKCNSIAFSRNHLLATGLDRARSDPSLNVYDVHTPLASSNTAAYRRLATSEIVSNVKFFGDRPDLLLAGIARQCIRLYDLREQSNSGAAQFTTRQVHFLSVDPLDENYFASVAPSGENYVSVWDRRSLGRSSASSIADSGRSGAVLEIKNPIDSSTGANVWSLRYSGYSRGSFAVLSSQGQIRLFDVARFPPQSDLEMDAHSNQVPSATLYTKTSSDLFKLPSTTTEADVQPARPMAFDFANSRILSHKISVVSIRQSKPGEQARKLELIEVPSCPPQAHMTSVNDLAVNFERSYMTYEPQTRATIAEDLLAIQAKLAGGAASEEGPTDMATLTLSESPLKDGFPHRSRIDSKMAKTSSYHRHEELLAYGGSSAKLSLQDTLTILETARRRCKEEYLFDCVRNKEIVRDDPWLVDLWDIIKRLENMARDNGMVHETLDLSYLGVYSIWNSKLGPAPQRLHRRSSAATIPEFATAVYSILFKLGCEVFEGVDTEYAELRQLGLAICGWKFEEKDLRAKCSQILSRREYYKAIVVAVCHGRRDIAIDILRSLTKTKVIENTAIAAVIACETVSKEQRIMCDWMAEEADDPYLKALLAYFVSGDWYAVVAMTELPLVYRVAVALKYLDDSRLSSFLEKTTNEVISKGDTEGVILTGLTEQAMDLFQNYISRYNDIQTAVLATAFVKPKYINDERWDFWKDHYFEMMQSWKMFIERTRFTIQHSRKGVTRDGKRLIKPPPRQVTLRCLHCQQSLAHADGNTDPQTGTSGTGTNGLARVKSPGDNSGTTCAKCGRRLPRCSVCMHWLGSLDPSRTAIAIEMERDDKMAKFTTFCASCNHASHAHHAREWFSKHQVCPVPDCICLCAQRH